MADPFKHIPILSVDEHHTPFSSASSPTSFCHQSGPVFAMQTNSRHRSWVRVETEISIYMECRKYCTSALRGKSLETDRVDDDERWLGLLYPFRVMRELLNMKLAIWRECEGVGTTSS